MPTLRLTVNGLVSQVEVSPHDVAAVFEPLIAMMERKCQALGRRTVVFLAGPPGSGKSTMALLFQALSTAKPGRPPIQALGMDGFHRPQAYLDSHDAVIDGTTVRLAAVKGSPESFDVAGLRQRLDALRSGAEVAWPQYDRNIHDVSAEAVAVTGRIVLVEGNYLLLDEPVWDRLRQDSDMTMFITADRRLLARRLIGRKAAGGMPRQQAEAFYRNSDGHNVERVLSHRLAADVQLEAGADGSYRIIGYGR